MSPGTVVITPGCPDVDDALDLRDLADGDWVAHTAIGLTRALARGLAHQPLLLVTAGERCVDVPRLGFAQRASRRAVRGYVLIDPTLPTPGAAPDWPDAPVTVVLTGESDAGHAARLRGWDVVTGDPAEVIANLPL
jgi:hypothetical protein